MFKQIICPVSNERIDSNVSRFTVLFNTILMVVFIFTYQPVYLYVAAMDYTIRAIGSNRFSPLCILASILVKALGLKPKMIDKAPKVFASRLGWICGVLGVIFYLLDMRIASVSIVSFFSLLTFLDSVVNVCVGCIIYNYLVFPFLGNKTT